MASTLGFGHRVSLDCESFPPIGLNRTATTCRARPGATFRAFSLRFEQCAQYYFETDAGADRWPDPASRFQPIGPCGPSQVVDPDAFVWNDADWPGLPSWDQVFYEMHIGTFTPEGTWAAAARQLAELASLGITVLEIMPIAEFGGRFGWSYDPANLFAPSHWYGIARRHCAGLSMKPIAGESA